MTSMPFTVSVRAAAAAGSQGCGLRLEVRPGPVHARPMLLDFFLEEARPRDHAEFIASGVRIWVPAHLSWLADNDVAVEAAADGHVHGAVQDVRLPY